MLGGLIIGLFFGVAAGIIMSAVMSVSRDNIDEDDEER